MQIGHIQRRGPARNSQENGVFLVYNGIRLIALIHHRIDRIFLARRVYRFALEVHLLEQFFCFFKLVILQIGHPYRGHDLGDDCPHAEIQSDSKRQPEQNHQHSSFPASQNSLTAPVSPGIGKIPGIIPELGFRLTDFQFLLRIHLPVVPDFKRRAKVRCHISRGLVSHRGILFHRLHADMDNRRRHVRRQGLDRHRGRVQVLHRHRHRIVSVIGHSARQHLIKHDTGGINVAGRVCSFSPRLFR